VAVVTLETPQGWQAYPELRTQRSLTVMQTNGRDSGILYTPSCVLRTIEGPQQTLTMVPVSDNWAHSTPTGSQYSFSHHDSFNSILVSTCKCVSNSYRAKILGLFCQETTY